MLAYILFFLSGLVMTNEQELFVFNSPETSGEWRIINDGVMGGLSQSNFVLVDDESAKFSGKVLPDNNGGFASVRAYIDDKISDDFTGIIIKAKGDGNLYNIRFRTNQNYDGVSYQAKFKSEKDQWREFKIPLKDFKPNFRGRFVPNQPKLESENIRQVGILISDKQFGEFELNIAWIKFYKEEIESEL